MQWMEYVQCPNCDSDCDVGYHSPSLGDFDHECEDCGTVFEVNIEYIPQYSAGKILRQDEKKCENCGKEYSSEETDFDVDCECGHSFHVTRYCPAENKIISESEAVD